MMVEYLSDVETRDLVHQSLSRSDVKRVGCASHNLAAERLSEFGGPETPRIIEEEVQGAITQLKSYRQTKQKRIDDELPGLSNVLMAYFELIQKHDPSAQSAAKWIIDADPLVLPNAIPMIALMWRREDRVAVPSALIAAVQVLARSSSSSLVRQKARWLLTRARAANEPDNSAG